MKGNEGKKKAELEAESLLLKSFTCALVEDKVSLYDFDKNIAQEKKRICFADELINVKFELENPLK
jgi:hypothetical protein